MSNYNDLVELRNRLVNDVEAFPNYAYYEEDTQLLDRVLDDLEKKDARIAELETALKDTDKWMLYFLNKCLELENQLENAIVIPEYIYRIVFNKNYSDFNNEKEFKIIKR